MTTIKNFQPEDMFAVIKLSHENLTEKYNPSLFNFFYETFPEGFIVAENYHKIVGFIIGVKNKKDTVRILMLAVDKKYRRQKVGTHLLKSFVEKILKENIFKIELEVRTDNETAISFYKKHGFEIFKEVSNFYQNGESAFILKKNL